MAKPTFQDAQLVVQLAQWQTSCGLTEAISWMWSDDFAPDFSDFSSRYPQDSPECRRASLICGYFDAIGILHKHGLVNEELLFDWIEVSPVWDRLKGYVRGRRGRANGKPLWGNFEALARAHKRQTREYST